MKSRRVEKVPSKSEANGDIRMPLCRPVLLTLSNYSFKFVIQKHDQETQPRSHSSSARADVTSPVKYF